MTYYSLKCATCDERFMPLLATNPGELLAELDPEDEEVTATAGAVNIESLNRFKARHHGPGHELVELTEEHAAW